MSITIFDSKTKYASIASSEGATIVLNELGEVWDASWHDAEGIGVERDETTGDVTALHLTDNITISKQGSGTSLYFYIEHKNGGKAIVTTSWTYHFVIVKSESGLLFYPQTSGSNAFYFGIAKTSDTAGTESWGAVWKGGTNSNTNLHVFSDGMPSTPTSNDMTLYSNARPSAVYYTQFEKIYALGSEEYFDDIRQVRICPSSTGGKTYINGEKWYITPASTNGMLALKYT